MTHVALTIGGLALIRVAPGGGATPSACEAINAVALLPNGGVVAAGPIIQGGLPKHSRRRAHVLRRTTRAALGSRKPPTGYVNFAGLSRLRAPNLVARSQ